MSLFIWLEYVYQINLISFLNGAANQRFVTYIWPAIYTHAHIRGFELLLCILFQISECSIQNPKLLPVWRLVSRMQGRAQLFESGWFNSSRGNVVLIEESCHLIIVLCFLFCRRSHCPMWYLRLFGYGASFRSYKLTFRWMLVLEICMHSGHQSGHLMPKCSTLRLAIGKFFKLGPDWVRRTTYTRDQSDLEIKINRCDFRTILRNTTTNSVFERCLKHCLKQGVFKKWQLCEWTWL